MGWPRLSESLAGERHPERCQSCGVEGELFGAVDRRLHRHIEHDQYDHPERIVVVLCKPCGDKIIEPHPRLYGHLEPNDPWPGCMDLCVDCQWREGIRCGHPDAKENGGTGVLLKIGPPMVMHLDGRRGPKGGRRCGWTVSTYLSPASECRQKDESDLAADELEAA